MDPGFYVIDIDGTLVNSHSDKEEAAPTYKRGFGFYPLLAYLDRTGEPLAALLRPGNAGSGTAADHIAVLDAALAQLPVDPHTAEVIARTDSADRHGGISFILCKLDTPGVTVRRLRQRWRLGLAGGVNPNARTPAMKSGVS